MKKIILIALLALVVIWAAATWLIGSGIEKGVQTFYDNAELRMTESGDNSVRLEAGEISRGFLSSETTTKIRLANVPLEDMALNVKTKIYHGPLMLTSDGVKVGSTYTVSTLDTSSFPQEAQRVLSRGFDDEEPLRTSMLFSFGGEVKATTVVPLFRHTFEDEDGGQSKVSFAGMRMEANGGTELGAAMSGKMEVGEFKISNDADQFSLSTEVGSGEFDVEPAEGGVSYAGTANFNIPAIKVTSAGTDFSFKEIGLQSDSEMDPATNTVGATARIAFASASTSDPNGPAGAVVKQLGKGGYIDYKIAGFDVDALKTFQEAQSGISEIQMQMLSSMMGDEAAAKDFDAEKAAVELDALSEQAIDGLLALFQPGMLFEFRAKLGDGKDRSDLKFGVAVMDGATPASEAKTLGEIVDGLKVNVDMRVSKSMLPEGIGEMILAQPIQNGMIEDRGAYYRGSGELKQSKVSLNGKELPIMEQFAPMLEGEDGLKGFRQGIKQGMTGGMGAGAADFPADMNEPAADAADPGAAPAPAADAAAAPEAK